MLPGYPVLNVNQERIKQISKFLGAFDRKAFNDGVTDLLPNHFSDVPSLLKLATTPTKSSNYGSCFSYG